MTRWNPSEDGKTHINVYSKGKTEVGRWASNFTFAPFTHPKYGRFASIEGLWYWLSVPETELQRDALRWVAGTDAKSLGRSMRGKDWVYSPDFEADIKTGLRAKYAAYPEELARLQATTLPLAHYYVMYGKPKYVIDSEWILEELAMIRGTKSRDGSFHVEKSIL